MQPNLRLLVVLCGAALSAPAAAQSSGGPGLGPTVPAPKEKARPVPPPALPGSRAEPNVVAPATRQATDMRPTEALFDAINRGDTAAGRDAISRGAELSARNVLGLTPLELSVDLGRNDLSFLLLSLRESSEPPQRAAAQPAPAAAPTLAERRAAARAERAALRGAPAAVAVTAHAPSAPHLFAGNGGAPIPQAGFLGFDPAR